jgi:hypothetical protein
MIPGTNLPWTDQAPVGTILPGAAGPPQQAVPGQGPSRGAQRERRGAAPVAPAVGIPTTPLPQGGLFPVPPPPPPKTSGGGGGGGGGGSKADAVSPVPGAPYTYTGFGELDWDALAQAESGGNWSMNNGNGYYGGLQFDLPTWNEFGGQQFAERPDLASKQDQIKVATALYNKRGTAPWPANGWMLTAGKKSGGGGGGGGSYGGSSYGGYGGGGGMPLPQAPHGFPQGASATYTPQMMQQLGISPLFLNPPGGGAPAIPPWVQDFVHTYGGPGLTAASTPHGALHGTPGMPGWAVDVTGPQEQQDAFAKFLEQHPEASAMMIHQSASGEPFGIAGGQNVPKGTYFTTSGGTYGDEANMVHWAPAGGATGFGNAANYSYDGPGQDRNSPMYVQSAKDTGGEQLGKDLVSGVMDIFGFGDLFKDPTQFGLFKIFKALMGVKVGDQAQGQGQGEGGGLTDFMSSLVPGAGGGGGGGGLLDFITGLVPKPYGELKSGSPEDAPGEFIPGVSEGGGGGSLTDFITGLIPSTPDKQGSTDDHSFNVDLRNAQFNAKSPVMEEVDNYYLQHSRTNLNSMPRK